MSIKKGFFETRSHPFVYCQWLLSCYRDKAEKWEQESGLQNQKYLLFGLLEQKLAECPVFRKRAFQGDFSFPFYAIFESLQIFKLDLSYKFHSLLLICIYLI